MRTTAPTEHATQRTLFRMFEILGRSDARWTAIFAVPNAGKRGPRASRQAIAEGLRSGVPDICVPIPRKDRGILFIELKREASKTNAKGRLSPDQKRWIELLDDCGNTVALCYGYDEAFEIVKCWMDDHATEHNRDRDDPRDRGRSRRL